MKIHSITRMISVNSLEKIEALNLLGVFTVRDMAEYAPCRHAALLVACFEQGTLDDADPENYVEAAALTPENIARLSALGVAHLISVSDADADQLKTAFGVETLSQLASFPPYLEAQKIIEESLRGAFEEKPSAPAALIPKLIGSTHSQARFSNYVREREFLLDDYQLTYFSDADEPAPNQLLIDTFYRARFKFYLGYLISIQQKWVNDGTHLGEPLHSLALAPGESRNVAVIEWYRRQRSSRDEDTTLAENLYAEFTQTRALNEVVRTTAQEHLYGSTEVDSSTKTTGAGLVGGAGGGKAQGGAATLDLSALVGLPVKAGAGAIESFAGSLGGSLVHSSGSVQGTLKSETTGERTVTGELIQNISDSTVQNSSNVRSVMSTVVVEDEQAGRQRAQTRNVTNYNHSHALTVQYFEVLLRYRVKTGADSLSPVLFLPFGPITFDIQIIQDYWYLFRRAVRQTLPNRFFEFDQTVKDFNPNNDAFDPSGDIRIERVKITRTKKFTEAVRVKLTDADPQVTLAVSGFDLDKCLTFKMTGAGTYLDYEVLEEEVLDKSSFGAASAFDIDEGIKASLSSAFTAELKKAMKNYLGDKDKTPFAPAGTSAENLEDNELAKGVAGFSDRDNLKDDVDNDRFKIINEEQKIELTLDVVYTIADQNGQTQDVAQRITKSYSYGQLSDEISEEVADVTAHIETHLATIADINPADLIEDIEQHFQFHKYAYTKYLLANVEKEQIIDLVEHLGLFSNAEMIALTSIIDPNPLGLTENLLIFKLKEDAAALERQLGKVFHGAVESPLFGKGGARITGRGIKQPVIRKGRRAWRYQFEGAAPVSISPGSPAKTEIVLYIYAEPDGAGDYRAEGTVEQINWSGGIQHKFPVAIKGTADRAAGDSFKVFYRTDAIELGDISDGTVGTLDWTLNFPEESGESVTDIINDYVNDLRRYEREIRQRHRWETVFLPTSGVFAEAILGLSNASEYINLRRFFNWQDSLIPNLAPALQSVNVNQDYSKPVSEALNPTVPVSVLNQISPLQYPSPTSLTSALEAVQNGSMFTDMSKTDQFATILGSLADLAKNTAQLSGNLAGDAAANALNAAVQLGSQVASMVGTALNTNVADPPQNPTMTGGTQNELDEIAKNSTNGSVSPIDQAKGNAQGTPIPTPGAPGSTTGGTTTGNGTGSSGTGTTTQPQPPATPGPNTADSLTGVLSVSVGLPDPYNFAVLNALQLIDDFIPENIDEDVFLIYQTLKEFIVQTGSDEAKKNAIVAALQKLKGKLKAPGWGLVFGLAVDLLTSPQFIEAAEGVLILMYDLLYDFCFPYLEFAGAHDSGVWFACDVNYSKTKNQNAQVGHVATAPFNSVHTHLGGEPTPAEPAFGWGVEQLIGAARVYTTQTDASNLKLGYTDHADGNGVTLSVEADEEVLVNLVALVQALRTDFMASLQNLLLGIESSVKEQLEEAVAAWLGALDGGALDELLDYMGFSTVVKEAIKSALASGGDIFATLAAYLVDAAAFVINAAVYCFDKITGFVYGLAFSPTFNYHLNLDVEITYNTTYPEGWTARPKGVASSFPELLIAHRDSAGRQTILHQKKDLNPQGLLGLLLPYDDIPQKTVFL